MNRSQSNPFKFGGPVVGEYYLPRMELAQAVTQFLQNRIPVVLIGARRLGKTSFVLHLLNHFEEEGYCTVFADIFNITSHRDFLCQMLRAIKTKKRWTAAIKESLSNLRPIVAADFDPHTSQSSFEISLDRSSEKEVKERIQDVLAGLDKLGEKVVFVIDEFQKITEIDDDGWLEATLRIHMQRLRNVSFLFTGSRRSIIYDMLNNHTRPLYRSCQSIEFPVFGEEFTDWIIQRFATSGIECDKIAIEHLRNLVLDTPNYVQMVCFHLVAEGKKHISMQEVETTLGTVVRQNAYAYQTLLNTLTQIQQRALRLAAKESKQIFSKELLAKYEIASPPALASAIKALKEKTILDEERTGRGTVIFDDPLFAIWLKIS